MRLSQYLEEERGRLDLNDSEMDEEFGRRIGRDRTSVYRLRTGVTRPTADILQAIVNATGGAVTPNDFFDLPGPPDASDQSDELAA